MAERKENSVCVEASSGPEPGKLNSCFSLLQFLNRPGSSLRRCHRVWSSRWVARGCSQPHPAASSLSVRTAPSPVHTFTLFTDLSSHSYVQLKWPKRFLRLRASPHCRLRGVTLMNPKLLISNVRVMMLTSLGGLSGLNWNYVDGNLGKRRWIS